MSAPASAVGSEVAVGSGAAAVPSEATEGTPVAAAVGSDVAVAGPPASAVAPRVVLLAHGSPDPRHAAGVSAIAEQIPVAVAYLQHHGPDLPAAVADAPPGTEIEVLPLLLSAGVHAADDVPELLAAARAARPELDWRVLPTMPPAQLLPAVLEALDAAGAPVGAAGSGGDAAAPGVPLLGAVGVAAGSSKPGALAAFAALTTAAAAAGVDLELANGPRAETVEAIDRLRERGHADVWVVPLLFADGILGDIAVETAQAAGAVPTRPVGEFPGCARALAEWAAPPVG